jgi:hypothetical protein
VGPRFTFFWPSFLPFDLMADASVTLGSRTADAVEVQADVAVGASVTVWEDSMFRVGVDAGPLLNVLGVQWGADEWAVIRYGGEMDVWVSVPVWNPSELRLRAGGRALNDERTYGNAISPIHFPQLGFQLSLEVGFRGGSGGDG